MNTHQDILRQVPTRGIDWFINSLPDFDKLTAFELITSQGWRSDNRDQYIYRLSLIDELKERECRFTDANMYVKTVASCFDVDMMHDGRVFGDRGEPLCAAIFLDDLDLVKHLCLTGFDPIKASKLYFPELLNFRAEQVNEVVHCIKNQCLKYNVLVLCSVFRDGNQKSAMKKLPKDMMRMVLSMLV